jgi:hypothetical protein
VDQAHYNPKDNRDLSPTEVAARNEFYELECIRAGGRLADTTDLTLKGRLEPPSGWSHPSVKPVTDLGLRLGVSKRPGVTERPLLVYIVDVHGKVGDILVLRSSGNSKYDAACAAWVRSTTWKEAAKLDGMPTAVLMGIWFVIKII